MISSKVNGRRLSRDDSIEGIFMDITQGRVAQIINNTNFGEINNLLSHGRDMEYIAGHYNLDLPLTWSLHLEVLKVSASLSNHISTSFNTCLCSGSLNTSWYNSS